MYTTHEYAALNPGWHLEDSPWKVKHIQNLMKRNNLDPKSICDIGTGYGDIPRLLSLEMPNTIFTAYEISTVAFEICKLKATEKLRYCLGKGPERPIMYELMLCIDVMEHVEDYLGFLREIKEYADLKIFHIPLEITMLSTVRDSYNKSRKKLGHLHYFTASTALASLETSGYEILDYFYTPHFKGIPQKSWKSIAALPFRILTFHISPRLSTLALGGSSVIVLAR